MSKIYLLTLLFLLNESQSLHICDKDDVKCLEPDVFRYPDNLPVDEMSVSELWGWLKGQLKKDLMTFCKEDISERASSNSKEAFAIVSQASECEKIKISFNGAKDKNGLPKNRGILHVLDDKEAKTNPTPQSPCLKIAPNVANIGGNFVRGLPKGMVTIYFKDGSIQEGNMVDGVFEGKIRQFGPDGRLQVVGLYSRGHPHGPVWLLPWSPNEEGVVLAFYDMGILSKRHGALYSIPGDRLVTIGSVVNSTFLEDPSQFEMKYSLEIGCTKVPQMSGVTQEQKGILRLPIKVPNKVSENGQLLVRTSRTLYFNRIAKTGSQAFIALLFELEKLNHFRIQLKLLQTEFLMEPPSKVAQLVDRVAKVTEPSVWIQHYNFVDFEEYGSEWSPDWFNVVRDPIDRIVSWFYYWRSAWNIVERQIEYPNEPLPDPKRLRKNFDTCVLDNDPECQFIQDSNSLAYGDHRSQMMAFCGHEQICSKFNSKEVLQRAKANVDRSYPVVGVLEKLNETLAVLEYKLPHVFKGASKIYYQSDEVRKHLNKNDFKLPVSEEVLRLVAANFSQEIEFYKFCRQRLHNQFLEIR